MTQVWMAQEAPEVRHICQGFKRRLEAVITAEGGHIDLYGRTPCGAHFYFMRRAQKSPQLGPRAHFVRCTEIRGPPVN